MREVYIIERDGNVIYYKIPKSNNDTEGNEEYYHEYYYKKYIKDNNIKIALNDEILPSFEYGKLLSNIGISSIIVENRKMFIFLPEKISKGQFNWFVDSKNALKSFNISYSSIQNNDLVINDPDIHAGKKTLIKDFYKYIKININNQKEGEINEHRRTI